MAHRQPLKTYLLSERQYAWRTRVKYSRLLGDIVLPFVGGTLTGG